ncbi:conjugal transfer protein [Photorhabdus heterorhabditis]|uniref:Conjugal transfer protein n=1 Tax=Photorhabdus heterorhabditis TaxID=880156 RepID=A0ABR5KAW6_9GAMM|nr:conjugal transfer protein TraW [Photorhabdus heterorhabditis]KOY61573.1 conjugal transfer protein [Photorhabdus heterorhabditis]
MKFNPPITPQVSLLSGLILYIALPNQSLGYPVEVLKSIPIQTQVAPLLGTMNTSLGEIATTQHQVGAAINQNGSKIATQIEQSAQAQRDQDIFAHQTDRLEQARRTYTVPDSICTESGSGMASQIQNGTRARQSSLASGNGISNNKIRQGVTTPIPARGQAQFRVAAIHADYCDAVDFAAYGGTPLCKSISELPGGDKRLTSLLDGAGKDGKSPDLTFDQKQTDAAMAYILNSSATSAGKQLSKGEVKTTSGQQYVGLMTQYEAVNSAAREPMLAMLSASQPNEATHDVLRETLTASSAAEYFNRTASDEAKRAGIMSEREFEQFEVGRRYANTNYQTDLQSMEGDNLIRESIRTQSLQNWLLLGIKQQLQKNNILQGQLLSLNATESYRPQLQVKMQEVNAGAARHD